MISKRRYTKTSKSSPAKRQKANVDVGQLKPVHDLIKPNIDIMFVGINPGIMSSQNQHHFANPQNFFWKGLYQSGMLPKPYMAEEEEQVLETYNIGVTNLVVRPTRTTSDLTRSEMVEAVPALCEKINKNTPKIICFVGKGLYEVFINARKCTLGLQHEGFVFDSKLDIEGFSSPPLKAIDEIVDGRTELESARKDFAYMFAMPSTSGRTAAYQNCEKLLYFKQLAYIHQRVRNAESIDLKELEKIGPAVRSKYFAASKASSTS